jgi:hypothetical protein
MPETASAGFGVAARQRQPGRLSRKKTLAGKPMSGSARIGAR